MPASLFTSVSLRLAVAATLTVAATNSLSTVPLPLGAATLVGSGVDGARSVVAGNVNGDSDLDVVVASQDDGRVRWFENSGNAACWTAHQIAVRSTASWAVAADVDGDNDLECHRLVVGRRSHCLA